MEIIAVLIPLFAFIIPFFVMFIIYAAVLALAIWFVITFLNNQKERNRLLAEISGQMKKCNAKDAEETGDLKPDVQPDDSSEVSYKHD